MARKQRGEEGGDTWLNTYADMVTLLLTFFVVMLSMSIIEQERFDAVVKSITRGSDTTVDMPGYAPSEVEIPDDGYSMETLYQIIRDYVEENQMESAISVSRQDELVYIRFSSTLLFEPDRYNLLRDSLPLLRFIGEVLKLYEDKIKTINIMGHTAQTGRINTDVSDWRLSGERAATVAMFFEDTSGFDKRKMITLGYGDNYPIADNATEAGRSLNRRVELVIVGVESWTSFDVYDMLGGFHDSSPEGSSETTTPVPETQ